MTIYLEDMGKVTFPFEPEEQIKKLAAFVTDFVKLVLLLLQRKKFTNSTEHTGMLTGQRMCLVFR